MTDPDSDSDPDSNSDSDYPDPLSADPLLNSDTDPDPNPIPSPYTEIRRTISGVLLCSTCHAFWLPDDIDYPYDCDYCPNQVTKTDDRGHAYLQHCNGILHIGNFVTTFIETETRHNPQHVY